MYEYIGDRIRRARETQGVSQKALGLSLGLSDKAISAYESGRILPPIETLSKIAKELDKPFSYFVAEVADEASLYDRIDRTEKMVEELITEIKSVKNLLLTTKTIAGDVVPPSKPI